jgi:hypothetical protein
VTRCDRCGRETDDTMRDAGESVCLACFDSLPALMARLAYCELQRCGVTDCGGAMSHRVCRPDSDRATLQSIERRAVALARRTTSGAVARLSRPPRALAVTVPDCEEAAQ